MEKEFCNEAHQPICCSPSLLLRHCVVKGQTLNKECTESDVWIFLLFGASPGNAGVRMAVRERECVRSKSVFSVCCYLEPGNLKFLNSVLPKDLTKEKTGW